MLRKKFTFPAHLICGDCYVVHLDEVLEHDGPFDVCNCQFALHYSWSTEAHARRALANVSSLLHPGGTFIGTMPDANVIVRKLREAEGLTFGNSVYWIAFDEEFAEKKFRSACPFGIKYKFHLEYDLELILVKNSHGPLGDGNRDKSTLSQDEWEAAYLYLTFVLRKRGLPDPNQRSNKRNGPDADLQGRHLVPQQ